MATTHLGSTIDTSAGTHTVTATPAVGDLIVIVTHRRGTGSATTLSDNNSGGGGTYTKVETISDGVGDIEAWIRDNLITSATSTIFTSNGVSSTGGGTTVYAVTGMTNTGASAERQGGTGSGAASTTPAVTLASAVLTSNPVIGAVYSVTGNVQTEPSAWTEDVDTSYTVPSTSVQTCHRDSGETATTITWGASSGTAHVELVVELNLGTPAAAPSLFMVSGSRW